MAALWDSYKVNGALGSSLVGPLAEEEQTLAGFGSPGSNMVGDTGSFVGLEGRQGLGVDGIRSEPEVLLGVENVPNRFVSV
jgi:hypothetical protein